MLQGHISTFVPEYKKILMNGDVSLCALIVLAESAKRAVPAG